MVKRVVQVLLVLSIGAVLTGALAGGLLWVALLGFAGLFLTGAVLLSLMRPLADDEPVPAAAGTGARSISTARSARRLPPPRDGHGLRRAA